MSLPEIQSGPRWSVAAICGGLLAAVTFTLSPLTVLTLIVAPFLIWAARRGVPPAERRALGLLLGSALVLRAAAIAVLFLLSDHDSQAATILIPDEAYTLARTLRIRNLILGLPALKYDYLIAFEDYGRTSYLWLVTFAQLLFGPSPYGLRLVNALFFLSGAILLFRLARRSFGVLPAFFGLTLLLFLPTWFFWSISLLKESLYFLLAASVLTALVECARSNSWVRRVVLMGIAAGAVFALRDLRVGAVWLILSGLSLGLVLHALSASARRFALGTIAIAIVAAVALSRPAVQARIMSGFQAAAHAHIGHVFTIGHPYKLLDEGFYVTLNLEPSLTPPEAARFAVRAAISFLLVPVPGQVVTRGERVQVPEHLIWYLLVVLTPFGIAAGLKRDRFVTCLLVGYMLPTAAIVALTNGNVGTLVRFRGLITPYLVWLGCLGFCVIMQRLMASARAFDAESARLNRDPV